MEWLIHCCDPSEATFPSPFSRLCELLMQSEDWSASRPSPYLLVIPFDAAAEWVIDLPRGSSLLSLTTTAWFARALSSSSLLPAPDFMSSLPLFLPQESSFDLSFSGELFLPGALNIPSPYSLVTITLLSELLQTTPAFATGAGLRCASPLSFPRGPPPNERALRKLLGPLPSTPYFCTAWTPPSSPLKIFSSSTAFVIFVFLDLFSFAFTSKIWPYPSLYYSSQGCLVLKINPWVH